MMISPETIAFVIRSAIRLGRAGRDAYEQKVRDEDLVMPAADQIGFSSFEDAERIFRDDPDHHPRVVDGDLEEYWDAERNRALRTPEARVALIDAREAIQDARLIVDEESSWNAIRLREEALAGFVLRQWNEDDGPPPPLVRVGLALAETALDFVGTNPSLFGVGGNGEKLVSAMAVNLGELLPDPDVPGHWPKVHFIERTAAIAMHAGLKTLGDHPEYVADEKHLQDMVRNVTKPLIEKFDENPANQPSWILLRDTIFGPVAGAAFETLVEHQSAFLGDRFSPDEALGAVTKAVLTEASIGGLNGFVSRKGLVRVYKAALGVAVERPELFVAGAGNAEQLAQELLSGIADAIRNTDAPFSRDTLGDIAAVAIGAGGRYASAAIGTGTPWHTLAGRTLEHFLAGVEQGIGAGDREAFGRLFRSGQAVEFARIVLDQVSKTPGMLVGADAGAEVEAIVAAVTRAMASDDDLLLNSEEWLEIAAVAAEEAARNPGRLFRLDAADPGDQLATKIIQGLLRAAGKDFRARGRAAGSVLFGQTLKEAVTTTLEAAAGNSGRFGERLGGVIALVERINDIVAADPAAFGADEWLYVYRELVTEVAESLDVATLSDDEIAARLLN